ncbi:MAG TPA: hypothetical protein DCL21_02370, partial [Alphaproteobacteria bacterium]|nr:hypothetical protein [Alphaproteobacteria bacterium]
MQPVFFISLFSLIFLMFSSMTAGLSKNIMQANIERVRETKDMFSQVEIAINKVAFKEKYTPTGSSAELPIVDLSRSDLTDLSGDFLAGHTSYTSSQLSKDMWGQKIYLFRVIDRESLWSGGAGEIAEAPVSTIMLISAGPNRRYDTLTNSGMDLKNLDMADARIKTIDLTDIAVIGDDVVVRFNNYEAMLDLWQKAENLDDIIKNVALDHYKTRLDAFSPLIQLAQRDVTDGMLGNDVFDDLDSAIEYDPFAKLGTDDAALVNEWNDPSSPVHALLIEYSGSPTRDGFRKKAKEYENEFRLAPKNFNDDGSFKNDDDNIAL